MISKQKILNELKSKVNEYRLGVEIAQAYGCEPSYVSQVLNEKAKYNSKLINKAISLVNNYEQNEAKVLENQAKQLGIAK